MKNRIREIRRHQDLKLEDLADKISVSRATVANYENGYTEPKLETWQKLADVLDVSATYLMGFDTHCQLCGKPIDGDK